MLGPAKSVAAHNRRLRRVRFSIASAFFRNVMLLENLAAANRQAWATFLPGVGLPTPTAARNRTVRIVAAQQPQRCRVVGWFELGVAILSRTGGRWRP